MALTLSVPSYAESVSAQDLPADVREDLLVTELQQRIQSQDYPGVLRVIGQMRQLGVAGSDMLYFVEGRALAETGEPLAAQAQLIKYLSEAGKDGRFYEQATKLLIDVKAPAQAQLIARERERVQKAERLARAKAKAKLLNTREARTLLNELGFPLAGDSSELDIPTREAIAVFQARRNLTVNGDITDELMEQLRFEAPREHRCDDVAFSPGSPIDVEPEIDDLDADAAVRACSSARRDHPHLVRFRIQYARALIAAGRPVEALEEVLPVARQGYPRAVNLVGLMHLRGALSDNGRANPEQAADFFRRAAEGGYPESQYRLGLLRERGSGVSRSEAGAYEMFFAAAEQGYVPAQVQVGRRLESGRGISRNYGEAVAWYARAAEQGSGEAQYLLGRMYEAGRGVKRDRGVGKEWKERARASGYERKSSRR